MCGSDSARLTPTLPAFPPQELARGKSTHSEQWQKPSLSMRRHNHARTHGGNLTVWETLDSGYFLAESEGSVALAEWLKLRMWDVVVPRQYSAVYQGWQEQESGGQNIRNSTQSPLELRTSIPSPPSHLPRQHPDHVRFANNTGESMPAHARRQHHLVPTQLSAGHLTRSVLTKH